jgi:hypothetical protein
MESRQPRQMSSFLCISTLVGPSTVTGKAARHLEHEKHPWWKLMSPSLMAVTWPSASFFWWQRTHS